MTRPRNRRGGRNTDTSTTNQKDKVKGLLWQHHLAIAILAALVFTGTLYFYHAFRRTYPVKLKSAVCLSDDPSPFFVPCKDREQHNKDLLQYILESASDLSNESMASASVTYMMSLAMRSQDTVLGQELFRWMMFAVLEMECRKLISIDEIDFQKETPRGLCAEAGYRDPEIHNHEGALEDFNLSFDMAFLMSMYGSQFHENAIRFTTEVQLERNGQPKSTPLFAGQAHSFYSGSKAPPPPHDEDLTTFFYASMDSPLTPYATLLKEFASRRNKIEHTRQGVHLLAIEMEKTMTVMRKCNPPANITWMEYHARAAFKSAYYEGTDDECGWANADDSFWEKVKLAYYDLHFKFRYMMGKI